MLRQDCLFTPQANKTEETQHPTPPAPTGEQTQPKELSLSLSLPLPSTLKLANHLSGPLLQPSEWERRLAGICQPRPARGEASCKL